MQWSIEPFRSYHHYFNVYRLEIVSQDSGISCDPDDGNVRRNTPFRLGFQNTCPAPPLARGITYGPALTPGSGCPALTGDLIVAGLRVQRVARGLGQPFELRHHPERGHAELRRGPRRQRHRG